ncbi:MAG: BON domain-containing protein [Rickettsiaceae bacterium]|nr:BON domain-containing protein [Rickettsiaceae bacterium]
MKKFHLISIFLCALSLYGCLPTVIFTGASATTLAAAKDRTFGDTVDDALISTKIQKEFIAKGFKKLYTKIHVEVVQSRVLLTGDVESEDDILSAMDIVWSISGVKEVINELKVNENSSKFDTAQYLKDTWISGRVKAAVFFNRSIKYVNYNIVTQRSVVYLFGIARSEDELAKVTQIASEVSGVEKVVSHVHLKDDGGPKITSKSEMSENSQDKEISRKNLDDDLL